jgi:hypothetical protein
MPVAGMKRKHVGEVRDDYAMRKVPNPDKAGETMRISMPRYANHVITVLSILLSYAVDRLGRREDNPALRPRRLRVDGDRVARLDKG